jgi:hypothetical protein
MTASTRAPVLALLLVLPPVSARADTLGDGGSEPEAGGVSGQEWALIGDIHVVAGSIFDETDPAESGLLYRLANRLHIRTHDSTIRSQLLFASGDVYSERILAESERVLRNQRFLSEPEIRPVAWHDGVVDVEVRSADVWSTTPGISLSRSGGRNALSFALEEVNLFGRGKELSAQYSANVDRSSLGFHWRDPSVLGSRWTSDALYSVADDGDVWGVSVDRPFYALATPWSAGFSARGDSHIQDRYALGEVIDDYAVEQRAFEAYRGWSDGGHYGWTQRWTVGFRYDDSRFAPASSALQGPLPADRTLAVPYARIELIQDGYVTTRNLDQIGRTEDLQYGLQLAAELGASLPALGADEAILTQLSAARGYQLPHEQSLFLNGSASGRLQSGELRDGLLSASARYFARVNERFVVFASLTGAFGQALDFDHQLELGGDSGLRGYPLRYQTGSSRVLGTVEARLFTDWYPLHLARVGAAVFADAGFVDGYSATGSSGAGTLRDVGFGLRLGNTRSALGNVLHIDLAFPLDDGPNVDPVQLLIKTHRSF